MPHLYDLNPGLKSGAKSAPKVAPKAAKKKPGRPKKASAKK